MTFSDTVSATQFNTLKVVDQAFRRCRLPVQAITAEMHDYAKDALYLFLSELANYRTPSWCIEKIVLDLFPDVGEVTLPQGTVEVLNVLYLDTVSNREIPLGQVNRDTFAYQSSSTTTGRPSIYWFQRDMPRPVVNVWPIPDEASSADKLVVWRHRHIMDVGTLQETLEVPQRWMEAIIAGLAQRLAEQTPQVDLQLLPVLAQRAAMSLNAAWEGDNDGSSTFYQPNISAYTR